LTFARSITSSPRPFVGGIDSSWRETATSTSAGPSCASARAIIGRACSGVSALRPRGPAASAIRAKSGLRSLVVKPRIPAAFR
jgi:hypothetical protein